MKLSFNPFLAVGILGGAVVLGFFIMQQSSMKEAATSPLDQIIEKEKGGKQPFIAPEEVQGIYLTMWSANSETRVDRVLQLARETGINAVVIDVKDFSGSLAYDTSVSEASAIGAEKAVIKDIEGLIERFHDSGIYTIARITVFQDPILAKARPGLAIYRKSGEQIWKDNKGLAWVDPAAKEVWEYNVAIAKDALSRGFDEINFDYIRFPSDGNLYDTKYPVWDVVTPLQEIIASFFAYLDAELPDATISADLFGLATVNQRDDMGIGQVLEDAFPYFDFISPMVYPSHFAKGYLGFENPSDHPYEVIRFSMAGAKTRLEKFRETNEKTAKLRPWLQYFDLAGSNITYSAPIVREQIQAVKDALGEDYVGFLLWDASNSYPLEELKIIAPKPPEQNNTEQQSS